eukprot:CAMPEP_0182615370 /NCGR_PEP_ID=MMETSP1330-20130603/34423_1 /TAXON_ID=464278 /ORGANISM="Picochlorum sp., Strain RCC944" /LENGTH=41 /DNA_ID= /DNA_START= /DNA_END= /DNA_ORIENTATION=
MCTVMSSPSSRFCLGVLFFSSSMSTTTSTSLMLALLIPGSL